MITRADRTVAPRELVDWLLARGRSWVTTQEAAELLGIADGHVAPTLARWRQRGHLFSPTKGLYVVVPPEYRSWGAVPPSNFIDPLMAHLGHRYYVSLLSAAERHGYAHQRPQVFQVMTPARLRDRAFGRVRIRFITSASMSGRPVDEVNTPTGTMRVSTVATTVLDLVAHPRDSGGLSNVATIVGEMLDDDRIDPQDLTELAPSYPVSVVQRAGWLLDFMANWKDVEVELDSLAHLASGQRTALLVPGRPSVGVRDGRWNLIANDRPEPDV